MLSQHRTHHRPRRIIITTITIPADIEAAVADLNGLGALITAKEWHRAAIVAAYVVVQDHDGRPSEETRSSERLSPRDFAALGIIGLKSDNTVRRYVQAWDLSGEPRPEPGQQIEIPNLPWKEWTDALNESGETRDTSKTKDIKGNPGAVAKALADPAFVEKVATRSPEAVAKVAAKAVQTEEGRKAVAEEMVKSTEGRTAYLKAEKEAYVGSDAHKNAQRVAAKKAAEAEAAKQAMLDSGMFKVGSLLPLVEASMSITEFLTEFEKVNYRADQETKDALREVAKELRGFATILDEIADGAVSAKISDKDLEALLGGSA